jgi:hypothetical protein
MDCFDALQRAPRTLKRAVAFGQPSVFLHGSVILLNHVGLILALAQANRQADPTVRDWSIFGVYPQSGGDGCPLERPGDVRLGIELRAAQLCPVRDRWGSGPSERRSCLRYRQGPNGVWTKYELCGIPLRLGRCSP